MKPFLSTLLAIGFSLNSTSVRANDDLESAKLKIQSQMSQMSVKDVLPLAEHMALKGLYTGMKANREVEKRLLGSIDTSNEADKGAIKIVLKLFQVGGLLVLNQFATYSIDSVLPFAETESWYAYKNAIKQERLAASAMNHYEGLYIKAIFPSFRDNAFKEMNHAKAQMKYYADLIESLEHAIPKSILDRGGPSLLVNAGYKLKNSLHSLKNVTMLTGAMFLLTDMATVHVVFRSEQDLQNFYSKIEARIQHLENQIATN
jgi:hypothetical protein